MVKALPVILMSLAAGIFCSLQPIELSGLMRTIARWHPKRRPVFFDLWILAAATRATPSRLRPN